MDKFYKKTVDLLFIQTFVNTVSHFTITLYTSKVKERPELISPENPCAFLMVHHIWEESQMIKYLMEHRTYFNI